MNNEIKDPTIAGNKEKGKGETIPFSTTGIVTKKAIMVTEVIPNNKEDNGIFTLYNEYKQIIKGIANPTRCILIVHMLKEKRKIDDVNDFTINPIAKMIIKQKTISNKT